MPEKSTESRTPPEGPGAPQTETLEELFDLLRPLVERISNVDFDPLHLYSACLRFAICRAFEFFDLSLNLKFDGAFFLVPALRPITEDLILYRFISRYCSSEDRDSVISRLMLIDVHTRIKHQQRFFHSFRPFQPVLALSNQSEEELERIRRELREIWRLIGLPGFSKGSGKRHLPPVREMAERIDSGVLPVVYDFIYRLTSGEVHSSPRILLRLGWGESSNPQVFPSKAKFSSRHMALYHKSVCQIYGAFLLCIWVELFEVEFGASADDLTRFSKIRTRLWSSLRWPEMVTFEEMNLPVPDPEINRWPQMLFHALFTVLVKDGFLSGAAEVERLRKSSGTRANKGN